MGTITVRGTAASPARLTVPVLDLSRCAPAHAETRAGWSVLPHVGSSLLGDPSPRIVGAGGIADGELDVAVDAGLAAGLAAGVDLELSDRFFLTWELRRSDHGSLELDEEGGGGGA